MCVTRDVCAFVAVELRARRAGAKGAPENAGGRRKIAEAQERGDGAQHSQRCMSVGPSAGSMWYTDTCHAACMRMYMKVHAASHGPHVTRRVVVDR